MPPDRSTRDSRAGRGRRPGSRPRSPPAGRSPPSVATQEEIRAPRLVAIVAEIRREQGVDVAARLEWWPQEVKPGFVERLAALAVIARLARGDEVLPGLATPTMTRDDVVEGHVVCLPAAVLAGMP